MKFRAQIPVLIIALTLVVACRETPRPVVKPATAPAPAVSRTPEQKGIKDPEIQKEADRIVPLFGTMRKVEVYIVDEPIESRDASVEPGVAYTVCSPDKVPIIYLKRAFSTKAPKKQMTNILKHELTHAWFCTQGIRTDHDARFRAKLNEVGGFGN